MYLLQDTLALAAAHSSGVESDVHRFFNLLLGTNDYVLYIVQWIFAGIGAFLSLSMQANKRNVFNPSTPVHFTWSWALIDNAKRILTTAVLIFFFIRFPFFFLHADVYSVGGTTALILLSFAIGFSNDKLSQYLKKVNFLGIGETPTRKPLPDAPPTADTAIVRTFDEPKL